MQLEQAKLQQGTGRNEHLATLLFPLSTRYRLKMQFHEQVILMSGSTQWSDFSVLTLQHSLVFPDKWEVNVLWPRTPKPLSDGAIAYHPPVRKAD